MPAKVNVQSVLVVSIAQAMAYPVFRVQQGNRLLQRVHTAMRLAFYVKLVILLVLERWHVLLVL